MKKKQNASKCPKCRAKLKRYDWCEKCSRCEYQKVLEPSNSVKHLYFG